LRCSKATNTHSVDRWKGFLRATALSAKRVLSIVILYVRPSVSVSRAVLIQAKVPLGEEIPSNKSVKEGCPVKLLFYRR